MRTQSGFSLVELLIVVLIMGFVASAAAGMLCSTMTQQVKLQNKCDSLESARKAMDRIGRIVRMGRSFGPGCSANTLVVTVPKFSDDGFPYKDMATGDDALETHTFQLSDTDNDNEFTLTWSKDPGPVVPASTDPAKSNINLPQNQILVQGILSSDAFRYVNRTDPSNPTTQPTIGNPLDYTGVTINFEVIDHKNSAFVNGAWKNPVTLAYKTEVFLRNNANLTAVTP